MSNTIELADTFVFFVLTLEFGFVKEILPRWWLRFDSRSAEWLTTLEIFCKESAGRGTVRLEDSIIVLTSIKWKHITKYFPDESELNLQS
jgi:hypothetical protein